ncbi:response regulator, partial [Rhodoplanes roseus]
IARTASPDDDAAIPAGRGVDAILIDRSLGAEAAAALASRWREAAPRRIVMLRPGERGELPGLMEAGFTDYLVKPVRAASLAGRLGIALDSPAPEPPADPARPPSEPPASRAVLVAEDNEINALLVRALLERLGHRVTVTTDGTAAVAAWQQAQAAGRPYDVVLMDLHMPGLDGLAATRRIRALEAEHGATPALVAALTADASPAEPDAYDGAGLDAVLVKPLDRGRLEQLLAGRTRGALAA